MSADELMLADTDSEFDERGPETDDDPAPIGLFQKPDDAIVEQMRLWWKESADALVIPRKARADERAIKAGHQWDDKDRTLRTAQRRPTLTLNLVQSMLAAVEGQERNNRQEIKIYGEGADDDGTADALNKLIKWVMNQCGGEFALSALFREGSGIGEAWIGFEVDYFDDPAGKIKLLEVPEAEMFPDPLSKSPVGDDLRYVHRVRMYSPDEMEARWPGSTKTLQQICYAEGSGAETDGKGYRDIYLTPDNTASPKFYDAAKKQWAVLESWWTQIEPGWVMVDDATGDLVEKSDEEFEAAKAQRETDQQDYLGKLLSGQLHQEQAAGQLEQMATTPAPLPGMPMALPAPPPIPQMPPPIDAIRRPVRRIYQAFSCYKSLLSKEMCGLPTVKRIPYVPFRVMWDDKDKCWYGLIRAMVDMQKQHNIEQSAMVHWTQMMAKNSWLGPKGSFHNKHEWEQKVAQPGQLLEYNARQGKPEPIKPEPLPRHMVDMAMTRPAQMREISGINVELAGVRVGADAGVVMEQRSKAALTVLAPLFDNYRESKKIIGQIAVAFIQRYVSVGRRFRVIGPEGADEVQMTADMSIGRFDVMVEETNATINDRIQALTVLQTTLPQMLAQGIPVAPELVDLLPMPPHIRDAQKRMVAWSLMINGQMPPAGWKAGDPDPRLLPPPGAPPPGAPPPQSPPPQ